MHFAVVEINLHVHDAVAGENSFRASLLHAVFHGRHEDSIHILSHERLSKLDTAVARFRLDPHPDFGELPRAASSTDWYRGQREHLKFAAIGG